MAATTLRLSDDERTVIAEVVSRRTNRLADMGPLAKLTTAQELFEAASRFEALARLAAIAETSSGRIGGAVVTLLREAEIYYAECVEADRRSLADVIAATDPEGWCGEGQTLDDLRVGAAGVLARSERGLAAIRALLGRQLLVSITGTGGN